MAASRRRRQRADVRSPTAGNPWFDGISLTGLFLACMGLAFHFGGTVFWASGPFFALGLLVVLVSQMMVLRGVTHPEIAPPPGTIAWLLLLAHALVRALFVPVIPYQAWTECFYLGVFLLFYITAADLCNRRRIWNAFLIAFLFAAGVQALYSLSLHARGLTDVLWLQRHPSYGMRASGTFICPNHFAQLLQLGMILGAGLLMTPKGEISLKLFGGYILLVGLPALYLTQSRSGFLGLIVGLLVLVLGKAFRRGPVITALATLLAGAATSGLVYLLWVFSPMFKLRMGRAATDVRITGLWPDTWRMIQGEGFWGVGPGIFRHRFESYRESFSQAALYLEHAHNEYLHVLADYGWPGLLIVVAGMLSVCILLLRAARRCGDDTRAMIPILMLALFLGKAAHAVFDFNAHIPGNVGPFVLLMGGLYGRGLQLGVWKAKPWPAWTGRVLPWMVAVLSPLLIAAVLVLARGSWAQFRFDAARKEKNSAAQTEQSRNMRRWMPFHWRGWTELGLEKRREASWSRNPEVRAGLVAESRGAYRTALRWNPYERIALMGLAQLEVQEQNFEAALEQMELLTRYDPFDVEVHIQYGLVLRRLRRYEEALAVFEHAQRLDRGNRQVQLNLQWIRQRLGDQSRAQ